MTDLRMWSQLSPEERAEAVTKAREIIDGGEVRWHVVARPEEVERILREWGAIGRVEPARPVAMAVAA